MPSRKPLKKKREDAQVGGVLEDEESTVEMENVSQSPCSKIAASVEKFMDKLLDMTPSTGGESMESMEQSSAELTPSRSEAGSEVAVTPSVRSGDSGEEAMSGEKKMKSVQYGLEKFFFGKKVKPAIEEHRDQILKDEAILKKKWRPSHASLALQEARKKGEVLVIAAVQDYNRAVEEEAARLVKIRTNGGRPGGQASLEARQMQTCADGAGALLLVKNSNRALQGAAKKRSEEGAATKLQMAKQMLEMKPAFATDRDWRMAMVKLYGKPWKTLRPVVEGKEEWEDRVKKLKLGKGSTGTTAAKGTCSKGGRWLKKGGVGARAKGAGRKDKFAHIKARVKYWLEKERSLCHHVDKQDLVEEFLEQCEDEAEACRKEIELKKKDGGEEVEDRKVVKKLSFSSALQDAVQGDVQITSADEDLITAEEYVQQLEKPEEWCELLEDRILKLKTSEKYLDTFGARLMRDIGARLMQPGRMSTLSMEEEEARVKATWKDFDVALWLAAFGSEEELQKYVSDPVKFMQCREELIIGFSDQIPVWVKIGRKKEVFCEREVKPRLDSAAFMKLQKERLKQQLLKEVEDGEVKQLEDSKAHEEEEKKMEDSKPQEEEEKVEDCKPHEEEKKVVISPGLQPPTEGTLPPVEPPMYPPDSEDEADEDDEVPLQHVEVEDDNLEKELEDVEMTVEEAGTLLKKSFGAPLEVFECL